MAFVLRVYVLYVCGFCLNGKCWILGNSNSVKTGETDGQKVKLDMQVQFSNIEINVQRHGNLVQLLLTPSRSGKMRNGITLQVMISNVFLLWLCEFCYELLEFFELFKVSNIREFLIDLSICQDNARTSRYPGDIEKRRGLSRRALDLKGLKFLRGP